MHSYSIDSDIRRTLYLGLAVAAVFLPSGIAKLSEYLSLLFASSPTFAWPIGVGATYGILFFLFDKFLWKFTGFIHHVPNLNGTWQAAGTSSYQVDAAGSPVAEFSLKVIIRQTFTRIEIFAESKDSTSRSTMASLCSSGAVTLVRYSFENTPKSKATPDMQRHPGLIELRMDSSNRMIGDYFSGKHRLRYGELTMDREPK